MPPRCPYRPSHGRAERPKKDRSVLRLPARNRAAGTELRQVPSVPPDRDARSKAPGFAAVRHARDQQLSMGRQAETSANQSSPRTWSRSRLARRSAAQSDHALDPRAHPPQHRAGVLSDSQRMDPRWARPEVPRRSRCPEARRAWSGVVGAPLGTCRSSVALSRSQS